MKYLKFITNGSDDLASSKQDLPDDTPYLLKPKILAITDARTNVGKILLACDTLVELNWLLPLTKEKIRLLCEVNVL